MTDLFISVLNMSITASYVILAVLVVRFFLKNLPKKYSYLLWSVVGFRLVCPVSFKSIISLFSLKPFDMTMVQLGDTSSMDYIKSAPNQTANNVSVGLPNTDSVIGDITSSYLYGSNVDWVLLVLSSVWAIGIFSLVIYSGMKYIRLRKSLNTAVLFNDNVYQAEGISSPFIIGVFKPKIYIPYNMNDDYLQYVLQHERYHIKRCDNVIKIIAYFLLILHWFNPLCYLAFYLMSKDMEMSCDEWVLSQNPSIKKKYSYALLSFASANRMPLANPLSFSENDVKSRIKNALRYKKPKKFMSFCAIVLSMAVLVSCSANPKQTVDKQDFRELSKNKSLSGVISASLTEQIMSSKSEEELKPVESHIVLGEQKGDINKNNSENLTTYFIYAFIASYQEQGNNFVNSSGSLSVYGITVKKDGDKYICVDSWIPRDGNYYPKDIKKYLPQEAYLKYQNISDNDNYRLQNEAVKIAVESNNIDINKYISNEFDGLVNIAKANGDYSLCEENTNLNSYCDYTLKYIYSKFLQGNQKGLYADMYLSVLIEMLGDEAIKANPNSPQEYFNDFYSHIKTIFEKNNENFVKANYPKSYVLLKMTVLNESEE